MLTDSSTAIWPADWSQFVPDAILTAAIGLALGLWLNYRQKRSEVNLDERLATRAWTAWRSSIALHIGQPVDRVDNSHDLLEYVAKYEALFEELRRLDIIGWAAALPKERELQLVSEFVATYPLVKGMAEKVTRTTHAGLVQAGVTSPVALERSTVWAHMTVLEVPDIARVSGLRASEYERIVGPVYAYPPMAQEIDSFRDYLNQLEKTYMDLRAEMSGNGTAETKPKRWSLGRRTSVR